jgi:aspartate kinase
MKKKVLKFGGTSVGSIDRIVHAAKIIKKESDLGNKIIVVVSAMAGKTNELISLSKSISNNFSKRELDVLLSTGEQISCALISGALNELGVKAQSFMNWQIPILTEGENNNARIINMSITKIDKYLSLGGIAIIPGYQGVSSLGEITTIGRGGSDATAVAIAKIFDTDSCEIYTDVEGVYSTDPNKIPLAKKIDKISYEEMLELSSLGAKVMQSSAVQTAMIYDIPLQVRSTFTDRQGTKIFNKENLDYSKAVTGVAYSKDDAKITLQAVEDKPGIAAEIFEPFGKNQINIDMVIQNVSSDGKTTDITFTTKREDLEKSLKILKKNNKIKFRNLSYKDNVSKISIVGAGMVTTPGVTYKMFRALADEKINILAISTSEIKISVIIDETLTVKAVKKLHNIFNLD